MLTEQPDFMPSGDGSEVRCVLCSPEEGGPTIRKKSVAAHIKGRSHVEAVEEHERRGAQVAAIAETLNRREQRRAEASLALQSINLIQPRQPALARNASSTAEEEFWADFSQDPHAFTFNAREDPDLAAAESQRQLKQNAEAFGIWNAHSTAQDLGFGNESPGSDPFLELRLGSEDPDELLADLLASTELDPPSVEDAANYELPAFAPSDADAASSNQWAPYESKTLTHSCITDVSS
ncbi:uncharacterized protein PHACADRAFT_202971 [Phanerochaete carnosa HHB-10118-sp]|uniref:Uncharacterized protein n=1 Tax=Phanerochaete carnosa (strain HHB-10118-sp) TaxID=650164 RepID=K5VNQ3_PHACS|nr:uncharacterized protein PHACADRAFT_202971 [Phanerochaete carnosa HHB-10118-sp]EKM48315.1 hypothetical protein PHACADRAFT_202971 [Phanerochaete carnosa HHB-10118-sp]